MNKKRNYGIDILRLVCMFGIVVLHTLRRSGMLAHQDPVISNFAWLPETIFYSSTNCFGMITGFVSYSEKKKTLDLHGFLRLWLLVVFYGVSSFLFFRFLLGKEILFSENYRTIFPLLKNEYWYFSAYTGVVLFSGLINAALSNIRDEDLVRYGIMFVLLFSVLEIMSSMTSGNDTLSYLLDGYSFAWLLIMYFFGALVRRLNLHERCHRGRLLTGAILLMALSYVWRILIGPAINSTGLGKRWHELLTEYTSPSTVLIALALLIFFASMQVPSKMAKAIAYLKPSIFSIYLLNSQPLVVRWIAGKDNYAFLFDYTPSIMILLTLASALAFVIVALLIDRARIYLFRLMNVDALADRLSDLLDRFAASLKCILIKAFSGNGKE